MAKRKEETGPGTAMILVLVFFVLATLILGVTTYLGYKGQDDLEKAAADAKAEQKKAADNAVEQTLRRGIDRTALGMAESEDQQALAGAPPNQLPNILDEQKKIGDKLGAAGVLPKGDGVVWVGTGDGPAIAPRKTIPQVAKEWEKLAKDAEARYQAEKSAKQKAQSDAQALQAQQLKDKEAFDAAVKALNDQMAAKIKAMDAAFLALKTTADQKGIEFKKIEDEWVNARAQMEEQLSAKLADIRALQGKVKNLENPDPSDIEFRWKNLNVAKMAERMGKITDKDQNGRFVNLQFSTAIQLLPGQTFVVIPSNRSLTEVLDREKALEKVHHERISLGPREPFTDNEMIKGMVEVTDVLGPDTARARITYETQPIRNPLSKGDQIFNMTLSSGEKEHVAFAGIIDLDGDGRPDTEAFLNLLKKNNLIVDSWLDLKTGQIKGKGMNSGTKFLILGSEAPVEVGGIKTMVKKAKENGTQIIDSRVFMSLIGVKPPRNAAPPNYPGVNLGTSEDAGAPAKEGDAAPKPPAAPDGKDQPKKEDK
jgi:hypothetical protein